MIIDLGLNVDFLYSFLQNIWHFTNLISFYILFGLLFAGVIKQVISDDYIKKHIGKDSLGAVFKAAILGIPLPLCSCSVIPFASSLQKSGASKSALQTFLIATPITGVDSIMATYGAFGWFFTLYRVISSVCISLLAGFLSMLFVKEKPITSLWGVAKPKATPLLLKQITPNQKPFVKRVFSYAFDMLFKGIAKSLLIGIVLGAFFASIIPKEFSDFFTDNLLLSYLFLILISAPMYVCALTSLPIGLTLILTGFSPGSAFVFLSAGPATNLVTISVVKNILGSKSLFIYLFSVIFGSVFFAYMLDLLFFENIKDIKNSMIEEENISYLDMFSSLLMFGLFARYLLKR